MERIKEKRKCSILNELCPRFGAECESCKLFQTYGQFKLQAIELRIREKITEAEKCGDCEFYNLRRFGQYGAKIGDCKLGYKKSTHIFGSSKACKKKLFKGDV